MGTRVARRARARAASQPIDVRDRARVRRPRAVSGEPGRARADPPQDGAHGSTRASIPRRAAPSPTVRCRTPGCRAPPHRRRVSNVHGPPRRKRHAAASVRSVGPGAPPARWRRWRPGRAAAERARPARPRAASYCRPWHGDRTSPRTRPRAPHAAPALIGRCLRPLLASRGRADRASAYASGRRVSVPETSVDQVDPLVSVIRRCPPEGSAMTTELISLQAIAAEAIAPAYQAAGGSPPTDGVRGFRAAGRAGAPGRATRSARRGHAALAKHLHASNVRTHRCRLTRARSPPTRTPISTDGARRAPGTGCRARSS